MLADRSIIVVSREANTVNAVSAALNVPGRLPQENVCSDMMALSARLVDNPVDAVLVDLDGNASKALATLDPLARKYPETRFIVLSSLLEPRLILEAMQAGARHFMTRQDLAGNLASVLRRLCGGQSQPVGRLITVLSASGGCGATTIAVNLAWELQAESELSTSLIVDLDFAYGGAGAYLGTQGTYGVRDLQQRAGSIDPELIATSATDYAQRLKVLVAAGNAHLGMAGSYERVGDMLKACAQSADHVVVDAPRLPLDVAAETLKVSEAGFLIMQLTVRDVRTARSMLEAFHARGVAPELITVLVNRYRKRSSILELEEAKRVLGNVTVECLPNDFRAASESLNFGKPLALAMPRSDLRRDLQQRARRLVSAAPAVNGVHG